MKKIIATVLTCCMVFGVASCGNHTDSTDSVDTESNINVESDINDISSINSTEAFDITAKDFFEDYYFKVVDLEVLSDDDLIILNHFEKVADEQNEILGIAHYIATNNNISIEYIAEEETDNLMEFKVILKLDDLSENDFYNLGVYFGIAMGVLDREEDIPTIVEELDTDNISEGSNAYYESDYAKYTKIVSNNKYIFRVTP